MNTAVNWIRNVDVVGFQIKPLFEGSNRMKTFLGGLLSIALATLATLGFVYFGREMVNRTSPSVSSTRKKVNEAEIMYEDTPFFMFAFNRAGLHLIGNPEFERAVKFTAEIIKIKPGSGDGYVSVTNIAAPMVKCTTAQ